MATRGEEFLFGAFANIFWGLGVLEPQPNHVGQFQISLMLAECAPDMKRLGLRGAAANCETLAKTLEDMAKGKETYINLAQLVTAVRAVLQSELNNTLLLHVNRSDADYYREPRDGWEEVINRFGEVVSDIEEASKCFALGRYAASVFHSTQVIELGLIELGKFLSIKDPKSGYTAVCNELKRILAKKYPDLTPFERTNRSFFEQVYGTAEALKNAWRNKIDHAHGRLIVMTADFSPHVAEEILVASRAFMRRLATEMPR